MTPARLAAARTLVAVERGRTTLGAEVERARGDVATARDRGLFLELVAGTLRWRNALDACLSACSRRPIADLDADVRATLRLGAYQLLQLDRVPDHAAVHEAVDATKALGHERAAGFVNAVLRALARRGAAALPPRPAGGRPRAAALAYLSVTLSHPDWIVARWLDRHGFESTEAWCRFNNDVTDVAVRPIAGASPADLLARLRVAGVDAEPGAFVGDAVRLRAGALGRLDADTRASLLVQDEASQLVAHAVGARPGERILDLCAAPGGKTSVLSGDMSGVGLLVASDHRPSRVALLRATLARARVPARVLALDAASALPFGPVFDRVLVDAPCSGIGTLRRDPDLKWSRAPADLPALASREAAILDQAAGAVRPGGLLVYVTCSSEPEENEVVVDRFLASRREFEPGAFEWGATIRDPGRLVDRRGFVRTLPFRDRLDAFFAAALRRRPSPGL